MCCGAWWLWWLWWLVQLVLGVQTSINVCHDARWCLLLPSLPGTCHSCLSPLSVSVRVLLSPVGPPPDADVTQFTPGPGTHAITVNHLLSWFHRWGNVVLTTQPAVALPLPLPQRPLVLTTATRASPLVQAVRTTEELQVPGEGLVVCGSTQEGACAAAGLRHAAIAVCDDDVCGHSHTSDSVARACWLLSCTLPESS